MFDADGRLANWWTADDLEHFRAAGAQLAAQYDAYAPFPDLHVNGRQTLSENIADVAGLAAAYDGWRASLGGAAPPEAAGFTGPQQFFLAYRPELADQVARAGAAPGAHHRRARAGRVPRRHRAQSRCVVRGVRRPAGPPALPAAGAARARLVRM